jgi:hypothetical protein
VDKRNITGIELRNLTIVNSLSNAVSVIAKNEGKNIGVLANATLQNINISGYGIGVKSKYGLFISANAHGNLVIKKSNIPEIKNESASFTLTR